MSKQPVVSVIIPVYNRAAMVWRAVRSVLAQSFVDYEIIIVDDGSEDQTREIVERIEDQRIRLLIHPHNRGAAAARNTGMRAADGKYIAWLDSDDEWFPRKIEAQVNALMSASDQVKACYTAYERAEKDLSVPYIPRMNDARKLYLSCDLGPGTTLMFERAVLSDIGFIDETLKRYEDAEWLLRYLSKYELIGVEEPLARVHDLSRPTAAEVELSAQLFLSRVMPRLRTYGVFRRIAISRRWMEVASYFALEHRPGKMMKYLFKALWTYPFQPVTAWAWLVNNWFGIKIGRVLAGQFRS